MSVQWKQLLESLEQNPSRGDLVTGVVCLCRTMQNPLEQANILTHCAALILQVQPLVALHLVRLALLLSPRDARTLRFAKEIFKRRGRWAAEQSVGELLATLSQATAVSPPPTIATVSTMVVERDSELPAEQMNQQTSVPTSAPEQSNALLSDEPDLSPSWSNMNSDSLFSPPTFASPTNEVGADMPSQEKWIHDIHDRESQLPNLAQSFDFQPPVAKPDESTSLPIENTDSSTQKKNIFETFLAQSGLELDLNKFSSGFSENNLGLVAFVNLLFTMGLIDELRRTNTTVILYRMIKESDDRSGAEELFEKLFMQRSPGRDK